MCHLEITWLCFIQVKFLLETKEPAHHQSLQVQKTCPSKIWSREVREKVLKMTELALNHNQAPAMMAPVHQFSHLGTQVQVDHRYIAHLVVEITTIGRIVDKIIFAQNVGQGHKLHKCAEHLPTRVKIIIYVCTVVAKTTLQVIAPVSTMTTGKSQGTSTVLDHILGQIPKNSGVS